MEKDLSALVEWLRLLNLSRRARHGLAAAMLLVIVGAGSMTVMALAQQRDTLVAAGSTLLAVALPVGLLVLLLFNQGDTSTLLALTRRLLTETFPASARSLFCATPGSHAVGAQLDVQCMDRGFACDYLFTATSRVAGAAARIVSLSVELNVNKANVVVWLAPSDMAPAGEPPRLAVERFMLARSNTFEGARREGYEPNPEPVVRIDGNRRQVGLVLIRSLGDKNFLLRPQEGLYWAQDLALFVQSLLSTDP